MWVLVLAGHIFEVVDGVLASFLLCTGLTAVTIHNTYWSLPDLLPTIPDLEAFCWIKAEGQIRQPELGCKTQMLVSVHHHI